MLYLFFAILPIENPKSVLNPLEFRPAQSLRVSPDKPVNSDELERNDLPANIPQQIIVDRFEIIGSTVFTTEELTEIVRPYTNRPLSFSELFQVRSAITKLYTEKGYLNSGAYLPPQELEDGTITIKIIEGKLDSINVTGTNRLNNDYVVSRLQAAAEIPINVNSLLEALQLLRLDPLIANISAELGKGISPGNSTLDVAIEEADPFFFSAKLDNSRTPSVGSNRRRIGLTHRNLLGFGDRFQVGYTNTEGSDGIDLSYSVPINASNGKLSFTFGTNSNDIIEEPFNPLDIESESRYYELSFRQPVILKPQQELTLGISFSHQESETSLFDTPFPLSRSANEEGETRVSTIRLVQEWVNRDRQQILAVFSQFSIGVNLFDATDNDNNPDSDFFAWRGQTQWVRQLDEDFLLILRGDVQLTPMGLVPLEQFRLGGFNSVRGYRQDLLLADNGLFAGAELRIPILRIQSLDGVIQLTPFVDLGTVWNSDEIEIDRDFLSAVGIGLNFSAGDGFNARLDWGIPLVEIDNQGDSLQENGIYFSIDYDFF